MITVLGRELQTFAAVLWWSGLLCAHGTEWYPAVISEFRPAIEQFRYVYHNITLVISYLH